MARKPIPGNVPPAPKTPIAGAASKSKLWSFSFRFWKQIKNFGLGESESKWFVALLDRFQQLSKLSIDEFVTDGALKNNQRYHKIDWEAKNIPIARSDCDWIPPNYLANEEEYPFVQFHISQALGRVVGFWDEHSVFNVILLDPRHNIQPSSYSDYRVRPCGPLDSEYVTLHAQVDEIREGLGCERSECKARIASASVSASGSQRAIVIPMDDGDLKDLQEVLANGWAKSAREVLTIGVYEALSKSNTSTESISQEDVASQGDGDSSENGTSVVQTATR